MEKVKMLRNKRKFFGKMALDTGQREAAASESSVPLDTGHLRIRHINQLGYDAFALRAHAELLNIKNRGFLSAQKLRFRHYAFPLYEGRPHGLKSFTQLCSGCPSLRNGEISLINDGNLTVDESFGGKKMKTKTQVIREIKTLAKTNRKLLNSKFLSKIGNSSLVNYAHKYFGTWNKAILASGEKPLYQKWSKERVIIEVKRIYEETGRVPNYGELRRKGERALPMAAVMYWGRWTTAIRAAGLKPYRNDYWTKEELISQLKQEVKNLGCVPSGKELKRKGRFDLVSSGSKFFGGYNHYLIAAGFEPVLIRNIWTKESVKNEILSLAKELKRTPTERDVITLGRRTLISAAWRQFKGWNSAIDAAGLKANWNFVKDKTWKQWEKFVLDICGCLYPDSQTHKILPNKTMPDFYDYSTETIIEVKINGNDTTIPASVRAYSPYCKGMEIWYLTGKPSNISATKVTFRGPDYIRDLIKGDKELLKQFMIMSNHYTQNGKGKN